MSLAYVYEAGYETLDFHVDNALTMVVFSCLFSKSELI